MPTEPDIPDPQELRELVALAIQRLQEAGHDGLEEMLRAHPTAASAIRRRLQVIDDAGMLAPNRASVDAIPDRLGEFRILERLGSGGMGVVFVAEQPSLGRKVALKVIRPEHLYFPTARPRFSREVEAIAQLQHPGIVRVFSAGEEGGLPYFTMELIEGVSLDRLLALLRSTGLDGLDENDVNTALAELGGSDQLPKAVPRPRSWVEIACRWVRELTDAVSYAHGRDVLHRDIKPSNIMITWSMRPMLLDFGLARSATDAPITRTGAQLGSLPYMAPEQVRGDAAQIGPRTDVYALGVLLYEMLTLRNPFHDGSTNDEETRQRIVAAAPPPVRLANAAVSWDAETVCRCAMAPEPEQRYADAASLGHDLQNLLDLRPITARRASAGIRMRRYVRSHPTRAVAALMGVVLLIAAPTVFAITERWLREDITRAKDNAEREVDTRTEILRFFNDELLGAVAPDAVGKDATMREVMDVAARKVDGRFPDRPLVEAAIRATLGQTYRDLGALDLAEEHLLRSVALYREYAEPYDQDLLSAERGLGMVYSAQHRYGELEELQRRNFAACLERFGAEHPDTLAAANNLGLLLTRRGNNDEAERILRDVVEKRLRLLGEEHAHTQVSMSNLGLVYYNMGRYTEAEHWVKRELDLCRAKQGDDHPSTLTSRHNHANLLGRMGRTDDALIAMEQVVAANRRVRGDRHFETVNAMASLAGLLDSTGRHGESQHWWVEMLRCSDELGEGHPRVLFALMRRADSLREAKKYAEASEAIDLAYSRCLTNLGERAAITHMVLAVRGRIWIAQERLEEASTLYDELAPLPSEPSEENATIRLKHARNLRALERPEEAERLLVEAHGLLTQNGSDDPVGEQVMRELAEICEGAGRTADAETWRQRLAAWKAARSAR